MTESLTELRQTVDKLSKVDERRAALIEYRDRQIVTLLDGPSPPTWVRLQELTGLSVRGLQQAIKRGREAIAAGK